MSKTFVPENYKSTLDLYNTQKAISLIKRVFEDTLSSQLHLQRVSAPLFVEATTGLNDDLSGVERAVSFDIKETDTSAQVVHSLAKWKRLALHNYGFLPGHGLYTDMNAIRRDEEMDNIHSIYVDQWDWEKVIDQEKRNVDYLKKTVQKIIESICQTQSTMRIIFPQLSVLPPISREITFVTTQELEDLYPNLTAKERENTFVKEHPTTFLMQIGDQLKSGKPHDHRAPDYDDWTLNGDILLWNPVLETAFEISSMGIRVDAAALDRQLRISGCDNRREFMFHKMLLAGELPLTMGGGIGQSRLCMLILGSAHIGEVQVSVWDEDTKKTCSENGITLL